LKPDAPFLSEGGIFFCGQPTNQKEVAKELKSTSVGTAGDNGVGGTSDQLRNLQGCLNSRWVYDPQRYKERLCADGRTGGKFAPVNVDGSTAAA